MRKAIFNKKNFSNKVKEDSKMKTKRVIAYVIAMVMIIMCGSTAMAAYDYGYGSNYTGYGYNAYNNGYSYSYNDNVTNYIPDYSGNGSNYYNGTVQYRYDNGYGYYGNYSNNGYYDQWNNYWPNNGYSADQWFTNNYGDRFTFYWLKSPQAPATRGDFFRAVYDLEMASTNNSYYYPQGGTNFADYWKYSNYSRLITVLNGTGRNTYSTGVNILDGRDVNGQNYLDFDYSITRGEAAKLLTQSNQAWWNMSNTRSGMDFSDCYNHWARYAISEAYALGFVNGNSYNTFAPDASMTNQEMLTMFCNVIDRTYGKYDVYDFISMVNAGDVARITKVNWNNNNNGGNTPRVDAWYFTQTPVYVNMGSTFNLRGVMSGWNDTIRFSSDDTSVASVSSTGVVTPVGVGRCMITGSDSYGITNSVEVVVQSTGSTLPVVTNPPSQMIFTQATISIQRGNSVNLMDYIKYAPGNVTFSGGNSYVTVSGQTATGIAVGKCTVTATSSGQTATVVIDVVDNNARPSGGVNPSVEWADNNTAGNLNFVIRGIDSSCEVRANDNSNYTLVEQYRAADWGKYSVMGLYPEGGTDTIVIGVYQNGIKVWESEPHVWYTGD